MTTVQKIADFWAEQIRLGRGQWEARMSQRGILGLPDVLPTNTTLCLVIPQPNEELDEQRRIVFGAARLREVQ